MNTPPVTVYLQGLHAKRSPLSYPALAPYFQDRILLVDQPEQADLQLFSHSLDVEMAPVAQIQCWRNHRQPLVWLSEEPFWDTIWGKAPLAPVLTVDSPLGGVPVHQINHQTSAIFRYDQLPYYLLTNPRFQNAYARMFARNAQKTPRQWLLEFQARPVELSFMFEKRAAPHHNVSWPEGDVTGLCAWRTELALACLEQAGGEQTIKTHGRSWHGGLARQAIAGDWHADKLATLDGHARQIGALENTHQPQYLTEKLFDAFACGARPLYWASDQNRIHDLALPDTAWANLFGLSPATAAEKVLSWRPDAAFAEAYTEAQQILAAHFGNPEVWIQEAERFATALHAELLALLNQRPASICEADIPTEQGAGSTQ